MQLGKYGSLTVANQPVLIADHFIYRMTFSCQWAPRFSCCMNYHFSFLYAINRNGLIDSSSTCLYWFWHVSLITRAAKLSICISTGSIQYIWHVNVRRTHIKNHFSAIFFSYFFSLLLFVFFNWNSVGLFVHLPQSLCATWRTLLIEYAVRWWLDLMIARKQYKQ